MSRHPNRMREYRHAAGLTQQELADAAGAGSVTIVRAETGKQEPTLDLALQLAAALYCTVDDLFGDEAPPDPPDDMSEAERGRRIDLAAARRSPRGEDDTPGAHWHICEDCGAAHPCADPATCRAQKHTAEEAIDYLNRRIAADAEVTS
jgi:putative transcriptional regulator